MSRLAIVLAFVFTASPLAAQGLYAGPVLVWDDLHYGADWGAAFGVTFQGLEGDANRRIDVRFVACCYVPMLQMSVLYAKMFNVDAYGTVGPAATYVYANDVHWAMLGAEASLGVELGRSETRVMALELGYGVTLPFAYDIWYGFEEIDSLNTFSMRLIYRWRP